MDIGDQDRWFNGEPAPVQFNTNSFTLGDEGRWFNSEPSPIQYGGTSPVVSTGNAMFFGSAF